MTHLFGRYSDSAKSPQQLEAWRQAEAHYASGEHLQAWRAFFDYLRDPDVDNVQWEEVEDALVFHIHQGSRTIDGRADANGVEARARLARMPHPSVAVMRKLLEVNYALNYSRFALSDDDVISIRFEVPVGGGQPAKLYHALREIALNADYYDDPLMEEFSALEHIDGGRVVRYDAKELATRHAFFTKWIHKGLESAHMFDPEKQAGAISWILLALVNRIEYLLTPQGGTIPILRKISGIYFAQGDRSYPERNAEMLSLFRDLATGADTRAPRDFYQVTSTFSTTGQSTPESVMTVINDALSGYHHWKNLADPTPALACLEYTAAQPLATTSVPFPVRNLMLLLLQVLHADFFRSLETDQGLVDAESGTINGEHVAERVAEILAAAEGPLANFQFRSERLAHGSPMEFATSFVLEMQEGVKAYLG